MGIASDDGVDGIKVCAVSGNEDVIAGGEDDPVEVEKVDGEVSASVGDIDVGIPVVVGSPTGIDNSFDG